MSQTGKRQARYKGTSSKSRDNTELFDEDDIITPPDNAEDLAPAQCYFKPNWQCQKGEAMSKLGLRQRDVVLKLKFCLVCTLNNIDYTLYKR